VSVSGPGCVLCHHTGRVRDASGHGVEVLPCPGCAETWTQPPARSSRGLRHHLVGALLWAGDMLTLAGHAIGRLAERIDPHP
jgi:hypothetical protein